MPGNRTIQVPGGGTYNPAKNSYTVYDPQSGQLISKFVKPPPGDPEAFFNALQNGQVDINSYAQDGGPGFMGGRSNVNVSGQIGQAFNTIMEKYPQMTKEKAAEYANRWVNERIAAGWDANEVENMMKDITRNPNSINQDFVNGVTGMISKEEYESLSKDATGATVGPQADPRGSIQDELRMFAGRMMQTVGPDSPQAKRIAELAAAAGNKYATASGMGPGGMTMQGVAGTAARAHTDLQTQREGLGAQALAAAGNQQLSVDQLKTQLQGQNQQAGAMNAQGIGGLIGSGVGLIGGLVASAYGGGAALPGLVAAGGAAGGALGGIVGNQAPAVQYGGGGSRASSYRGSNQGGSS